MKRLFLALTGWLLCLTLYAQSPQYQLQYWFDGDYASHVTSSNASGVWQTPLEIGHLSAGFHTLYLHFQDTSGRWSSPRSYMFYKTCGSASSSGLNYACWFDQEDTIRNTGTINGSILLDVSAFSNGFHIINVMIGEERNASLRSFMFYKIQMQDSADTALTYICWFDEDYASRTSGEIGSGNLLFDVSSLSDGFHNANILLGSGRAASVQSWIFYKMPDYGVISDSVELIWHYSIDGREFTALTVTPTNRLIHLDLDVDNLRPGLHSISYYMTTSNGKVSELNTSYFYRTGTGIARYEYWFNGDDAGKTVVNIQPQDTMRLITMLQVPSLPIRSTCFEFDPNEGTPVIYAKNDVTFRFWTKDSRYVDHQSYYVDEYVKDTVIADTLIPHISGHCSLIAPIANNIRWYMINGQIGDSIAVKTSRSSMLQLFAPSGEEVYSASDLKSIEFGGCNMFEDGYYYLAVHDVAPSSDSLTVYYQHIGKFAVLAHSPDNIGNLAGSYFDMELFGNGMMQLDSVWLTQGSKSLTADTIVPLGRTKAIVTFHIADSMPNGMYSASFRFRDILNAETIVLNNAILFEPVNWGEIKVSYNMPSRMAKPYPVVITLENSGNIDLTYIPLNIAYTEPERIAKGDYNSFSIEFGNFYSDVPLDWDTAGYEIGTTTDNLFGRHINGGMVFLYIPILHAHEKKDLELLVRAAAHERFNLYAWTGRSLEECIRDSLAASPKKRSDSKDVETSQRTTERAYNMLDFADRVDDVADFVPHEATQNALQAATTSIRVGLTISRYHNDLGRARDQAVLDDYGVDPSDPLYEDIQNNYARMPSYAAIWGFGDDGEHEDTADRDRRIADLTRAQRQMAQQPTPHPGDGCMVHVVVPGDPNDIIGYIAESGSHYIRRGITNVSYEIEFENDTSLASAAAHTIWVRDTLDETKFNFSSFNWTGIRIGDHSINVDGGYHTVKTIDLRPDLNVVAQVNLDYNATSGIAIATITSLDPMTLEPTTDPDQGALPVNYIGNGVGSVSYDIELLDNLSDGTSVTNRASIVFDNEDAIMTPIWTNTMDLVDPESYITHAVTIDDSTTLYFNGTDDRSGVWRYTLHGRKETTQEWTIIANNIEDSLYQVSVDDTMVYYMVTATDSAGNMEVKTVEREYPVTEEEATYFYITVNADAQQGTVTGGGRKRQYRNITLTATPNYGYHFIEWSDGDTNNPRVINVVGDTVLTALFDVNQYRIEVVSDDWNAGIVYGSGLFDYLTTDTLNAIASGNYHFTEWSDGNTDNPRILTVTEDIALIGYFAQTTTPTTTDYAIYADGNSIVAKGFDGNTVTLYDVAGNVLATNTAPVGTPLRFESLNTGIYYVKIGVLPIRMKVEVQ
ncbi:MAG: T9SS type A sorting domain-containing protein [Bacteroidales bacterium]|nr:T9SS type A sorting domain-containing protein [Bacteroidales bacterium]